MNEGDYDDADYQQSKTCDYCDGTGGNPWDDRITPCQMCDGEGYEWWH